MVDIGSENGDSMRGRVFSLTQSNGALNEFLEHTGSWANENGLLKSTCSFGEDAAGELYVVSFGDRSNPNAPGSIHRVVPSGAPVLYWDSSHQGLARLRVMSYRGRNYQFESSDDLTNWQSSGDAEFGADDWIEHAIDLGNSDAPDTHKFWRVRASPWAL